MKIFTSAIILLLLGISVIAQDKNQETLKNEIKKIKNKPASAIKYDKFDDVTSVYLGGYNITKNTGGIIKGIDGRRNEMFIGFTFSGETLKESPKEFVISFALYTNRTYPNNEKTNMISDLKLLADKERFTFDSLGKDSILSKLLTGISEPITSKFKISRDEYEKISKASSISLKLGSIESEMNQKQIELFSQVLELSNIKK
jgi:hypothetical protein